MGEFRDATREDATMLFRWRNDPLTVAASLSGRLVTPEEHEAYLDAVVDDTLIDLLVWCEGGTPKGVVRMEWFVEGDKTCGLSWTVAPNHRGRGLGKEMVRAAVEMLPEGTRVTARIKEGNTRSRSIAVDAGMECRYMYFEVTKNPS